MSTGKGSDAAAQIEKALDEKTGKASGDTDKSPERKFEEMGIAFINRANGRMRG